MKLLVCIVRLPAAVLAHAEIRPALEFQPLRGRWTLDETAGRGHIAGELEDPNNERRTIVYRRSK